jgi:hypothetical protein
MTNPETFFIKPELPPPKCSYQAQSIAHAFVSHYRYRRHRDHVRGFYFEGISYGSRYYFYGELTAIHLTVPSGSDPHPDRTHWYYFRQPEWNDRGRQRHFFDRLNAICIAAYLPAIHQVGTGDLWIWADGRVWSGQRIFRALPQLSGRSVAAELTRALENPWS